MKTKSCNAALLLCLPLILLVACRVDPTPSNKVPYTVDLQAAKGATKIEILTPDQGCSDNGRGKKGCVECKKNQECTIEFRLNLEHGQVGQTCQEVPPPDWVITEVQLSENGSVLTGKGAFGGEPPDWMLKAFPGISEKNGSLPVPASPTQSIILTDLNNHRYGGLKTAYYQVTATSCVAGIKPITIDPAIQNKGK